MEKWLQGSGIFCVKVAGKAWPPWAPKVLLRKEEKAIPEHVGVFGFDPLELIAGSLPQRQTRLVEAWIELHREELQADWEAFQNGRRAAPIAPLE